MPVHQNAVADDPQLLTIDKPLDDRRHFLRLLTRLTVYYAGLGALLWLLLQVFPGLVDTLPIGGVQRIAAQADAVLETHDAGLIDRIATSGESARGPVAERLGDAMDLLIAMTGVILLMLPVAWVYRSSNYRGAHDHSLDETAFVLPVVVAGIVIVVQHSLALAFSLAGIVAGVRFRRALKDTYDALYILMAIGVGIAAGVKALDIAAVLSIFFNYTTVIVCTFGDGLESHHKRSAKIAADELKASKASDASQQSDAAS